MRSLLAAKSRPHLSVYHPAEITGWKGFEAIRMVFLPALAGGVLATILVVYFQRGFIPGDSFTYLAAGERLNAGHSLFALLPGDAGAYAWWSLCLIGIGVVLAALFRRRPATTSVAVIVLAIPIAYEIGVGNVNALLLAAAIACWLLARDGQPRTAGALAAVMFAVKLTPLPIAAWVVGTSGRRGVAGLL